MDWFSQTEHAATGLISDLLANKISQADAQKHPIVSNGYMAAKKDGYLHLTPMGPSAELEANGWKFHISVAPKQIKDAWNEIAEDLMKAGVSVKVSEERKHAGLGDPDNPQRGKSIVLYAKDRQNLTPLLKKIEQKLTDAGIKPGLNVLGDRQVVGSSFIAYRNDMDNSGKYVSASQNANLPLSQQYNPLEKIDPFKNLDVTPSISRPSKPHISVVDIQKLTVAQMTLATAGVTEAFKGEKKVTYLGVGKTPEDIEVMKAALKIQGFEEGKHYAVGTSSLNQGGNVIKLTDAGISELDKAKADFQAGKPPVMVVATPSPTSPSEPAKPAPLQQPQTPEQQTAIAGGKFRQDVANPTVKPIESAVVQPVKSPPPTSPAKVDIDLSDTPAKLSADAGKKLEGRAGKAVTAIEAADEAFKGNYGGAAATVAMAIAQEQGVKFAVKRIPIIGGIVTAGMTLFSAGSHAAQGNFKKAGSELVAGAAETVINGSGLGLFGVGDLAREGLRKVTLVVGVKEENAPDKSGLRIAVETAYSMGKTITDASKLKLMGKTELASAIQKDPNMVDEVSFKGNRVALSTALEHKEFRTKFLKTLEAESKAGTDRSTQIAMIKAFETKLESGQPVSPASTQVAQSSKPATADTASPQQQAQVATLNAQYKSMSTTQLASAILKDNVLPDSVQINGKNVSITDAIKDGTFRDKLICNLETLQAKGQDYTAQIAMLKAYDEKMDASSNANPTTQVAQAQRPTPAIPPSISAPMA